MNTNTSSLRTPLVARLAVAAGLCASAACTPSRNVEANLHLGPEQQLADDALAKLRDTDNWRALDARLDDSRNELIDLAYEAASRFPVQPHVKSRSRAQETVVGVCFELGQPYRAVGFAEGIANWRRAVAYGDFALYCARHRDDVELEEIEWYLDRASEIAEEMTRDPDEQSWRVDRIRVKVAQAWAWLGQAGRAADLEQDLVESESGKVDAVRALQVSDEDFEAFLDGLDDAVEQTSFDTARNQLVASVRLYERFYDQPERRAEVARAIEGSWTPVPPMVRIDILAEMADVAIEHGDGATALLHVAAARELLEGTAWQPRHEIPLAAKLIGLRHRAGDVERAREEAAAALALYERVREETHETRRAGMLRPLAEAAMAMGDHERAVELYALAVEEGARNPNARPRANDLTATCLSMAVHEVQPPEKLWKRLVEIFDGLTDPW